MKEYSRLSHEVTASVENGWKWGRTGGLARGGGSEVSQYGPQMHAWVYNEDMRNGILKM